jgi:hypothetical protein
MIIEDPAALAILTGALSLGAYFVKWLTNGMTEAIKSNTTAITNLTLIIERCRYREEKI